MTSETPERARSIRAVFPDAEEGYLAIHRLRAAGFRIEVSGSTAGDLIVTVQAAPAQLAGLADVVAAHEGRLETQEETADGSA